MSAHRKRITLIPDLGGKSVSSYISPYAIAALASMMMVVFACSDAPTPTVADTLTLEPPTIVPTKTPAPAAADMPTLVPTMDASTATPTPALATSAPLAANLVFAKWNELEPQPWWRESKPYSCLLPTDPDSPWAAACMIDLGGSDPFSLIGLFGNGSYLRYSFMGFKGCTPMRKYPDGTHLCQ